MNLDLRELHDYEQRVAVAGALTGLRRELRRTLHALRNGLLHLRRRLGAGEDEADPRIHELFALLVAELDDAEDAVAALRVAPLPCGEARADLREALEGAAAGLLPANSRLGVSCPDGVAIAVPTVELALLLRCVLVNATVPLRHLEIVVELAADAAELVIRAGQCSRDPRLAQMIERSLCLAAASIEASERETRVRLPRCDVEAIDAARSLHDG